VRNHRGDDSEWQREVESGIVGYEAASARAGELQRAYDTENPGRGSWTKDLFGPELENGDRLNLALDERRIVLCLRVSLADAMVRIHLVRRDLVNVWIPEMNEEDVARRFQMYARLGLLTETELSVAGPVLRAGQRSFYPVDSDPATKDGSLAALNPVSARETRDRQLPDLEVKEPGPMACSGEARTAGAECGTV